MPQPLCVVLAQVNFLVGAVEQNTIRLIELAEQARDEFKADLIVFPELTLTAYPPEDLLFRQRLHKKVEDAIYKIRQELRGITVLFGYPEQTSEGLYNSVMVIKDEQRITSYRKQELPNYGVFDEKRYFIPGESSCVFDLKGIKIGVLICEDLWFQNASLAAKQEGAQLLICLNASPFDHAKPERREIIARQRTQETHLPLLYVNAVGGQDELVFDGGSFVMDETGQITQAAEHFKEVLLPIHVDVDPSVQLLPRTLPAPLSKEALLYEALVLGVRDYACKNGFKGGIIGLSGGIDSALTLAIAVDALGPQAIHSVAMPSQFTALMSIEDAKKQAQILGVEHHLISIEPLFEAALKTLEPEFINQPRDTTEENLQARCRGMILMALSNKFGHLVLTTGNKSEMAVGYATLYGDMAGGFCVLKDVPKTLVYRLAHYRNQRSKVIPDRVIERPPSAELAPDQLDQDTLPPYPILDDLLERYIEKQQEIEQLIAAGFDRDVVLKVIAMVRRNEYKRRQAPPGVRITERAFGRDRRYPITSGYF